MQKSKKKTQTTPAKKHQSQNRKQLLAVEQAFQGPIPPPSTLAGYEQLLPGAADRILAMAESETKHRQAMEKTAVEAEVNGLESESKDTRRGQYCGLIIGVVALLAGAYTATAANGSPLAGSFLGAGGVMGLVSAFIVGRKTSQNHNQQTKEKAPTQKQ